MAPKAKSKLVRGVFDSVAGNYDLMNDLMSLGVHRFWKASMIDWLAPQRGGRFLDVAGGTGDIARLILRRVDQQAEMTLVDINAAMIEQGRDRALDGGWGREIDWIVGDAEALPFAANSFDYFTIAFGIRNVTHIEQALAEAHRVLRPGGRFLCLEFSSVALPVLNRVYDTYSFSVLPALGQWVARDRESYVYLAESIRRFPDQTTFQSLIQRQGLERASYRNLSGGIAALHSAWKL
ncbi:MAG: bifunctional demethylmenaquinone methyltransferase/2-methoxy-6-polyprenyl-1,4-benzoquinol methylase UbiE [Pseudomonadota bacterium]